MSIEDVIQTLDPQYQLSSYLKLRGHISYKAAKLCGQYMAKTAKLIADSEETTIDSFNAAMGHMRGQHSEDLLMNEMGMAEPSDMWATVKAMVLYANKLNFDMQALVDPTEKLRNDPTWKFQGVFFTEEQQRKSWVYSLKLISEADDSDALQGTYEEYAAAVANPEWLLSKEEWALQQEDDNTLFEEFAPHIVDRIMEIGFEECDFDELPIRTQIAAIENMKGKVPSIFESALKSVKYNRDIPKERKVAESTTVKGLVNNFTKLFCAMLDSTRYEGYEEFMYSYIPNRAAATDAPVTRRMITRSENTLRQLYVSGKRHDSEMQKFNDDFILTSDEV
jgi:hypothetical protein